MAQFPQAGTCHTSQMTCHQESKKKMSQKDYRRKFHPEKCNSPSLTMRRAISFRISGDN